MHCNMEPLKVASTALRYIDPISGAFFELALCRMVSANASFRIRLRGNLIARILMLVDNRQVNKYIGKNEVESQGMLGLL